MRVENAEGRPTGDGEGGLHPLHRKEELCQRGSEVNTSWHRPKTDPGGATGRGSAT